MNKKPLLLISALKAEEPPADTTIGVPGEAGFGVGCFGGTAAELAELGLKPMPGFNNPAHANYGNYKHDNGSVLVFIPAFAYRVGNAAAPKYDAYGANSLEISDARNFEAFSPGAAFGGSADLGNGWTLHRAFVNGGLVKSGFFIDKYSASIDPTGTMAISVAGGNPIGLTTDATNTPSASLPGCSGQIKDALIASAQRGKKYACETAFMRSALSMISFAHGQASTSTAFCAWFDSENVANFPKGNTGAELADFNDPGVTFSRHTAGSTYAFSLTGSGVPFAKTTHNGQANGVTDVCGNKFEVVTGINFNGGIVSLLTSVAVEELVPENIDDVLLYEAPDGVLAGGTTRRWGIATAGSFYEESTGNKWGCNGFYAAASSSATTALDLFGRDFCVTVTKTGAVPIVGGGRNNNRDAGIFARHFNANGWAGNSYGTTFRAGAYAS